MGLEQCLLEVLFLAVVTLDVHADVLALLPLVISSRGCCSVCSLVVCVDAAADSFCVGCGVVRCCSWYCCTCWKFVQPTVVDAVHQLWRWLSLDCSWSTDLCGYAKGCFSWRYVFAKPNSWEKILPPILVGPSQFVEEKGLFLQITQWCWTFFVPSSVEGGVAIAIYANLLRKYAECRRSPGMIGCWLLMLMP